MERIQKLFSDLRLAYQRLQPRERRLVAFGGAFFVCLALGLSSFAVSGSLATREKRIQTKLTQLEEVRRAVGGYRAAESQRAAIEGRLRGAPVKLFSLVEEQAKKHGIEIGGMVDKGLHPLAEGKINEISVEVSLNKLPLDKLVRFLTELETGQAVVKVTKLQIRPRTAEAVFDASLVVSTYQLES